MRHALVTRSPAKSAAQAEDLRSWVLWASPLSSLRGDFPVTCLWLAVILTLHPPQKQSPVVTVAPARVILQLTNAGVLNLKLPWEDPYWELEGGFAVISKQSLLGNVSSELPPTKAWITTGNDMQHDLWKCSWLVPCVMNCNLMLVSWQKGHLEGTHRIIVKAVNKRRST